MSRHTIAEQLRTLADAIRCEDPPTSASLDILAEALHRGREAELADMLTQLISLQEQATISLTNSEHAMEN